MTDTKIDPKDVEESFLEKDYEIPVADNGIIEKFPEGITRFRVLSRAVVGYETWKKQPDGTKRPFRAIKEEDVPKDGDEIKHFWYFIAYIYPPTPKEGEKEKAGRVQIIHIKQKTIMTGIKALLANPKWGDPKEYDLVINRKGLTKDDTEYVVLPDPKSELDEGVLKYYQDMEINLEARLSTKDNPHGSDPYQNDTSNTTIH